MTKGNGKSFKPHSVNIPNEEPPALLEGKELMNSILNQLVNQSKDIELIKTKVIGDEKLKIKGMSDDIEELKIKLQPVIAFHKKVLTIVAILALPFTMLIGWAGSWLREQLSK